MVTRVAHLSTAHGRCELRVHLKECNSLAAAGYEVHYIVADGLGHLGQLFLAFQGLDLSVQAFQNQA